MIRLYSTTSCAWCKQVERYLQYRGVQYEKVMIDDDMETRQMLLHKTGMTAVPVTSNGDAFVVGWNVPAINSLISSTS